MSEEEGGEAGLGAGLRNLKLHIHALAGIHDLLIHDAKEGGEANSPSAKETLEKLIPLLRHTVTDRIIRFTGQHVRLNIAQSTALALIVNELTLNAVKFGTEGVEITLDAANGIAVLEVCDDGPGFPERFDLSTDAHNGLTLVQMLTSHDLRGFLSFANQPGGGARVSISFPVGIAEQAPVEAETN